MKIIFSDGTTETFDKADAENCEIEENFYLISDEDKDIIAEVNLDFIKIIRWD